MYIRRNGFTILMRRKAFLKMNKQEKQPAWRARLALGAQAREARLLLGNCDYLRKPSFSIKAL